MFCGTTASDDDVAKSDSIALPVLSASDVTVAATAVSASNSMEDDEIGKKHRNLLWKPKFRESVSEMS